MLFGLLGTYMEFVCPSVHSCICMSIGICVYSLVQFFIYQYVLQYDNKQCPRPTSILDWEYQFLSDHCLGSTWLAPWYTRCCRLSFTGSIFTPQMYVQTCQMMHVLHIVIQTSGVAPLGAINCLSLEEFLSSPIGIIIMDVFLWSMFSIISQVTLTTSTTTTPPVTVVCSRALLITMTYIGSHLCGPNNIRSEWYGSATTVDSKGHNEGFC